MQLTQHGRADGTLQQLTLERCMRLVSPLRRTLTFLALPPSQTLVVPVTQKIVAVADNEEASLDFRFPINLLMLTFLAYCYPWSNRLNKREGTADANDLSHLQIQFYRA